MSVPKFLLDTNVLIRFLVHDDAVQSPLADALFAQADRGECVLVLTDVAIAESVWVLSAAYKIDRAKVADSVGAVMVKAGIRCLNLHCMLDALIRFKATNCDFLDCYLAAMAAASGNAVASFDRDMRKFKDITLWQFAGK
jgi:predicted nucleic-acid-binding protein